MIMYVAIAKLLIKAEGRNIFERIMNKSTKLAKLAKGNIDFKILRPRIENAPYVIYAAWETKEDLSIFNSSEEVGLFQIEAKEFTEYIDGKSSFEEYDCI
jgi:heme-degrading monooxygenase HmoA